MLDQGCVNTETLNKRMDLMKSLNDFNCLEAMEAAQKYNVRWSIEGDENAKYFHGILNRKRSQLSIRGVFEDGEWVTDPVNVKHALFSHFANRLTKVISFAFIYHLSFQTHCQWIKWKSWKGRFLMKKLRRRCGTVGKTNLQVLMDTRSSSFVDIGG